MPPVQPAYQWDYDQVDLVTRYLAPAPEVGTPNHETFGSMLMEGIFTEPHLFSDFLKYLNQYGLFDINSPATDLYVMHYNELNKQGYNLEVFSDDNVKDTLDKVWWATINLLPTLHRLFRHLKTLNLPIFRGIFPTSGLP